jgi:hypothetical protein
VIKRRIQNILRKEWELLFTDVNSSMIVTVLPLLIVGQLTLYIWLAVTFGRETILQNPLFQSSMVKLTQALPATANLPQMKQLIVLFINQFIFFLLLIPTMIAISIATFSIVDEKLNGSLEALLATPARTWEILLGKALAGAIPALVMTWLSAGIFLLVISALGWGNLIRYVINPSWFLSLFLLTPGIAMLNAGCHCFFKGERCPQCPNYLSGHYLSSIRTHCRTDCWSCLVYHHSDAYPRYRHFCHRLFFVTAGSTSFPKGINSCTVEMIFRKYEVLIGALHSH